LISGPVPVDEGYASVPMTESGSGEHGAEAHASGKNAELERWKSKSVEMDWVTWRRQMCVSLLLLPSGARQRCRGSGYDALERATGRLPDGDGRTPSSERD